MVSETTLRDLVKEAKANEGVFKTRVRKALRSSYSSYYRRMLPRLLGALQFRSNNTAHQPVVEALDLLGRYAERPGTIRYYAGGERTSANGSTPARLRSSRFLKKAECCSTAAPLHPSSPS